jgi:hypothetical protein
MAARLNSIDLGPMSLPFNEQSDVSEFKLDVASRSDIEKLKSLLKDGGNNKRGLDQSAESQSFLENNSDIFLSAIDNSEKINQISSISVDCVDSLNKSVDQLNIDFVELTIQENLLPDATINALKKDNQFYFELCVGSENYRLWLVAKLPELVREIGERINHPLVISVFSPEQRMVPIATISWPVVDKF